MQENSYNQIRNYFKNLVEQSKFLNGYSGFFQRELVGKMTNYTTPLQAPYLALFEYNLGFDGPDNNTIAVRKIGMALMYNKIKADDQEQQYNAIHNAEQLAGKLISRVRFDSNNPDHFLYNSFLKDSVEISAVELSATDFGVEIFFSLKNKQLLIMHTEDWKDIPHVCL